MKIKHIYTGVESEYVPSDNVWALDGRYLHACPVCGIEVCSPINGPMMVHKMCMVEYVSRHGNKYTL